MLTADERDAIKALCKLDPVQKAAEVANWNAAADALAVTEVDPSPRTNFGGAVPSTGKKEMTLAFPSAGTFTNWMNKIASDTSPLATNRFSVSEFEFSNLGTTLMVLAGKKADIPGAAFATWETTSNVFEEVRSIKSKA